MAAEWMRAPDGEWVVLIPEHEVQFSAGGKGLYTVERRDGTSVDVMVVRVGPPKTIRGRRVCCGVPETAARERSARVSGISHVRQGPFQPRLSKQRDELVAPVSVLRTALEREGGRLEVDDLSVWIEPDEPSSPWSRWSLEGVRMAKVPVAAAKAS